MKLLVILVLICFCGVIKSQNSILDNFPTKEGLIVYTEIVEVDSTLKAVDLYLNAKNWIVEAFKSSQAVIEIDEKEARVIAIKAYIQKHVSYVSPKIWFTLKIEMKDGRYRYTLSNTKVTYDVSSVTPISHYENSLESWINETETATSTKKWVIEANEEWRTTLNTLCIDIDSDFKSIIRFLEKSMEVKSNKDW
ncbi:MAG: DUF4468 domain-containing protein [Cyclobacteriaceae bacterium]|nr:DUF4468 domain-containing protein [Cyclobacteriaceae bacterium]